MAPERRSALLEWAEDEDALIVEDDYDSRAPLRPRARRCAPGTRARARVLHRVGQQAAGPGDPAWVAAVSLMADRRADATRRRWRTGAHRQSSSSRWRTSSRAVSSTAICAGCGSATARRREALVDAARAAGARGARVRRRRRDSIWSSCSTRRSTSRPLLSAAAARGVGAEGLSWHRIGEGPDGRQGSFWASRTSASGRSSGGWRRWRRRPRVPARLSGAAFPPRRRCRTRSSERLPPVPVKTEAVGKTYEPTTYAVGREKIREYAAAVGETNPLHHDVEAARAAGYADVVAPPMFAVVFSEPRGRRRPCSTRRSASTSR